MTTNAILKLLDPKTHNCPKVSIAADFKKADIVVVPVAEGGEKKLQKTFPFLKKEKISTKKGERTWLIKNNKSYSFVGIGPEEKLNFRKMRRFFGAAFSSVAGGKPKVIGFYCLPEWVEAATISIHVAALNPGMLKPKFKAEKQPDVLLVHQDYKTKKAQADKALKAGQVIGEGKNIMRVLGSLPPNILNTKTYAEVMLGLAKNGK